MANEIIMPKLGLTMTEGTLSTWHKKEGDKVSVGEAIFDVETDKLTNTIESTHTGVLLKIIVQEGDTVPCLAPVAIVGKEGEVYTASATTASNGASETTAGEQTASNSILVIGGGPGGYVAAIRAALLGGQVTLVERDKLGGTCLNRGCMPTKALLHASEVYELAKNSEDIGIIGPNVGFDWEKVQASREKVTKQLTGGVKALMRANKIRVVQGEAKFTGPKTVSVGEEVLSADKIIIASGSSPAIPPIEGLAQSPAFLDSTACLALDHVPESLLVIGGGVIGLELGCVYARFGSKVHVVEMQSKLLPQMDAELTSMVQAQLEAIGISFYLNSTVKSVIQNGNLAAVTVSTAKGEIVIEAEKILLSAGRNPNTESLGLEKAGIKTDGKFISINRHVETTASGVYAIGDCSCSLMLAHAAMAMGEVAAANAMGDNLTFDPNTCPTCAYIGPEFASVGLNEDQVKARGIDYKIGRFPTAANGRSLVSGHTNGLIKVIAGAKYGEILGVHILAQSATELIAEAALAIRLEATIDEFVSTMHCHPTVSEALREAALAADNSAIHIINKR